MPTSSEFAKVYTLTHYITWKWNMLCGKTSFLYRTGWCPHNCAMCSSSCRSETTPYVQFPIPLQLRDLGTHAKKRPVGSNKLLLGLRLHTHSTCYTIRSADLTNAFRQKLSPDRSTRGRVGPAPVSQHGIRLPKKCETTAWWMQI